MPAFAWQVNITVQVKEKRMSEIDTTQIEKDRQLIIDAKKKGTGATVGAYAKLSGPGWLQSAITLGGGSLAGSLYLGIIGGYEMMWLQPLMMIFGIVMLSAIGFVALSTGEKPFRAINKHVNPVLGWGWAIATLMANLVWAMPQFSLGTAAVQQNLGVLTGETGGYVVAGILFVIASVVIWFYDSGGWGIKLFEALLKVMVAIVVLSFFLVVIVLSTKSDGLEWGRIIAGFVPNPGLLFAPAETMQAFIDTSSNKEFWTETILSGQRDRMVAAAATAVGINMTFLLPYSMLKRGWGKDFRGLAVFDLSTGLFIPFVLATSCVVITAAHQFHGKPEPGLVAEYDKQVQRTDAGEAPAALVGKYKANLDLVLAKNHDNFDSMTDVEKDAARAALPMGDKMIAATLIKRDAFALADSLESLAGKGISQYVFGIGVVGMALSSIIILMLINGFTICEMLGQPSGGMLHRIGCFLPGITGAIGAFTLWKDAKFYLAVPTSVFGMMLLPIAYVTFFFLMNNRSILGKNMLQGGKKSLVNLLMLVAVGLAGTGATIAIANSTNTIPGTEVQVRWVALGLVVVLGVLAVIVHFVHPPQKIDHSAAADTE